MEFFNTNGTVARALGRAANQPYVCIGLDVENADIVLADTHSIEAFNFLARHAVSCFYFLGSASNPSSVTPLVFNSEVYRHRGVTKTYGSVRTVVCKSIEFEGVFASTSNCLSYLTMCSTLGASLALLNKDQSVSKLSFDFGSAIKISGFSGTITNGSPSTVVTLTMFNNDVVVYSGAPALLSNVIADRAELTFSVPIAGSFSTTLTNIRFLSSMSVEYEEDVRSILVAKLDFTTNRPWSQQISMVHYSLDEVDLANLKTGLLRSTVPLVLALEGTYEA